MLDDVTVLEADSPWSSIDPNASPSHPTLVSAFCRNVAWYERKYSVQYGDIEENTDSNRHKKVFSKVMKKDHAVLEVRVQRLLEV
jgi:hypothetical protein